MDPSACDSVANIDCEVNILACGVCGVGSARSLCADALPLRHASFVVVDGGFGEMLICIRERCGAGQVRGWGMQTRCQCKHVR